MGSGRKDLLREKELGKDKQTGSYSHLLPRCPSHASHPSDLGLSILVTLARPSPVILALDMTKFHVCPGVPQPTSCDRCCQLCTSSSSVTHLSMFAPWSR